MWRPGGHARAPPSCAQSSTPRDRHVERVLEQPPDELRAALGDRPRDARAPAAWGRGARAVAAYRFDHHITGQGRSAAAPTTAPLASTGLALRASSSALNARSAASASARVASAQAASDPCDNRTVQGEALELTVLLEDAGEGWIMARVPQLPGVVTQGRDRDEARRMARSAVRDWLTWWLEEQSPRDDEPPSPDAEQEPLAVTVA